MSIDIDAEDAEIVFSSERNNFLKIKLCIRPKMSLLSITNQLKDHLLTEELVSRTHRRSRLVLHSSSRTAKALISTAIAKREDNTRCVDIAKRHNLKVKALMSIGHAGESFESVENTKQWLYIGCIFTR